MSYSPRDCNMILRRTSMTSYNKTITRWVVSDLVSSLSVPLIFLFSTSCKAFVDSDSVSYDI